MPEPKTRRIEFDNGGYLEIPEDTPDDVILKSVDEYKQKYLTPEGASGPMNPGMFAGPTGEKEGSPKLPPGYLPTDKQMLRYGANTALGAAPFLAGAPLTVPTAIMGAIGAGVNTAMDPDVFSPTNAMNLAGAGMGFLRAGKLASAYEKSPIMSNMGEGAAMGLLGSTLSGEKDPENYLKSAGLGAGVGFLGGALSKALKYKAKTIPEFISPQVEGGLRGMSGPPPQGNPLESLINRFRGATPAIEASDAIMSGPQQLNRTTNQIGAAKTLPVANAAKGLRTANSAVRASEKDLQKTQDEFRRLQAAGPEPYSTTNINPKKAYDESVLAVQSNLDQKKAVIKSLRQTAATEAKNYQEQRTFYRNFKNALEKDRTKIKAADEMVSDVLTKTGFDIKGMSPEQKEFITSVAAHPESSIISKVFKTPEDSEKAAKTFISLVGGRHTAEAQQLQTQTTQHIIEQAKEGDFIRAKAFDDIRKKVGEKALDEIYGPGGAKRVDGFFKMLEEVEKNVYISPKLKAHISTNGILYAIAGAGGAGYGYSQNPKATNIALGAAGGFFLYQNFGNIARAILRDGGNKQLQEIITQFAMNKDTGRGAQLINRMLQTAVQEGAATQIKLD